MRFSIACYFNTSVVNLAKRSAKKTIKGKADLILVRCDSVISGHRYYERRGRLADKLEFVAFDPIVQQEVLYKEAKKIRSIQEQIDTWYNKPSVLKLPDELELEPSSKNKNLLEMAFLMLRRSFHTKVFGKYLCQQSNISQAVFASEILKNVESRLEAANVAEPKSSAHHLMSSLFGETNIDKFVSKIDSVSLTQHQLNKLEELVECRLAGMPIQYIVGNWDFLDLTLKMRPPVFIPRPETEELTLMVIDYLKATPIDKESLKVVEMGCGSGAISLSLVHGIPGLKVVAVDQSELACSLTLEIAVSLNLENYIHVVKASLKEATLPTFLPEISASSLDCIVSNPPYVLRKDLQKLQPEILLYEDLRALDGGAEGLSVILPLLAWAEKVLKPGGRIFLEIDPCHQFLIPEKLKSEDIKLHIEKVVRDFNGYERFIVILKNG